MKLKTKAIFLLLLNIVTLTSCKSNDLSDYSLYYSYNGEGKGLEVYCRKKKPLGIQVYYLELID